MSEEQISGSAAPETVSDVNQEVQTDQEQNSSAVGSVAYDTHKRLLAQKKKQDEELAKLRTQVQESTESALLADGKKDELIASLQSRLAENVETSNSMKANFAFNSLSSQVLQEASQMGCQDNDALLRLTDLASLEVSDDFRADPNQIKMLLDETKQKRPYLFAKSGPTVASGTPATPDVSPDVDLKDTKNMALTLAKLMQS